jgi:branched-chain amino acid transport system permease protein
MPERQPSAGSAASGPRWRRGLISLLADGPVSLTIPLVLAVLAILLPAFYTGAYWIRELSLIAVLALVVSGVNLSFGYAGELQLGQVFMYATGAYVTMILAVHGTTDIIALMLIGGIVAVAVGILIAVPAMRIGGWSLAMASFFLVITIPDLAAIFSKWTGGLNGLTGVPIPTLLGHQLSNSGLYEVTAIVAILWFACYRNLVTSRYGVVFRVLRESPVLTRSLGYSPAKLKTTVYALGAFPAGVAGCLFGFVSLIVEPGTFGLTLGIGIVAASVLGGTESVYGVFIGAALLQLGPEKSVSFATYAPVVYGGFLIVAATVLRGGAARLGRVATSRAIRWLQPGAPVPVPTGDAVPRIEGEPYPLEEAAANQANGRAATPLKLPPVRGQRISVDNVSKSFGGLAALAGVTLTAEPGQVTGLIGSNGSGKTTLLNVICGYVPANGGTVKLDGNVITRLKPHQVARLGVGRTFQTPTMPRGVSVRDVVASGRYAADHIGFLASILRLPRYRRAQRADRQEAGELLRLAGIERFADQDASSLPLGTRRLVEVARTLCARPSVVLLDEAASGLNDTEVAGLAMLVRAMAEAGATVIVIEHNFRFITSVSRTIHVLHLGRLIATGAPEEISRDQQVIESYLGKTADAPRERKTPVVADPVPAAPLLELHGIESGYGDLRVLQGVSMSVPTGSIEAVLGRNGVGKTTLLSTIAGLLPAWRGTVSLLGKPVGGYRSYRRSAAGISLVQEGKRIFRQRTVWQNVVLGTHGLRISGSERQQLCRQVLELFPALRERTSQRAGGLSGGQQQMLAIAQALAARPKVLLLDEPSAGLAPTIVDELFARLRALADDGLTILLVEQLADKALAIADHVTVLDRGKVVTSGAAENFEDTTKLEAAYGLL